MTGILGWIIRITLLLLKNTRSRGEYQRQAGSGRPSQPTSWPLNACGCQGSTFFYLFFSSGVFALGPPERLGVALLVTQTVKWVRAGRGRRGARRMGGEGLRPERRGKEGVCAEAPAGGRASLAGQSAVSCGVRPGAETRTEDALKLAMIGRPGAAGSAAGGDLELSRGSLGAASAKRACLWAKVPPQACGSS